MEKLKFLSEVINVEGELKEVRIEDVVFEDCLMDKGLYIETYYNPDGVYNDEESSDGGSIYTFINEAISYFKFINIMCYETGCELKDSEVTFRIINNADEIADLEFINISELIDISTMDDLVNLKEKVFNINQIMAIKYSEEFPDMAGIEFSELDNYDNIVWDEDLNIFLDSLKCSINNKVILKPNGKYLTISNGKDNWYVPFIVLPNRFNSNLPDETFINFNLLVSSI